MIAEITEAMLDVALQEQTYAMDRYRERMFPDGPPSQGGYPVGPFLALLYVLCVTVDTMREHLGLSLVDASRLMAEMRDKLGPQAMGGLDT